ncbi:MAG TPA: hypothetical protein VNA04_12555 [Thermoanaerobaculia bacterium]|nr:hypothetical protein [Thermoanaerobaculia bacterium]
MQADERRHDPLALAMLVLLPTLFFADVLLGLANFCARDLTRYYYPTKQIHRQIVYGGELPLWNPYFGGGQPLAANPEHAIFYPLTWLTLLPSYDLGYRLHILLHLYIALLGMYALLRSMRTHPAAAFLGALAWGMGGLYLSYVNLLPIFFCAAWLPLTSLHVRRFLLERRRRDFALASLFLGLQFLAGEPTTIMQTGLLIGLYALYRGWVAGMASSFTARAGRMVNNLGWIAAISVSGFAVGAVQMLAAIDHVGDSARARPFPFELVAAWSMPWAKLAELVYPNFLGHVQVEGQIRYWGAALYESMGAPFLFSIYPGLAVTALAAAGLLCRARGAMFVLAVSLLSVALALGGHTPLLRLLHDAGIATSIRYPEKFILLAIFALTVFGARMFDRALSGDERLQHAAAGFALATALIASAISLLGFTRPALETWMDFFRLRPGMEAMTMAGIAWSDWSIAAARGLLLFLLFAGMRSPRRRLWWAAAFLFLCADLGLVVRELNPRLPARFFTTTPETASTLRPERAGYRVFHAADWLGGDRIGLLYPEGTARYWIARNGLFPAIPAGYGIRTVLDRDYDETALLPTIDFTRSMWEVRRSGRPDWLRPFLAMSNAWYRAVMTDERSWMGVNVEEARPVRFIEGPHFPRYYFADQIVEVADRSDFVGKLSSDRHSDRVAFVERDSFTPAAGRVIRVEERSNSAAIDVETAGRAFLVISVTPHKYWRITVGGEPVRPVVTNIGYQGVVVPRGRHRVIMEYRNDVIAIGAIVSASATVILIFMAVLARRRSVAIA